MISSLSLTHFRNHDQCEFSFSEKGAVFVGKNGTGKTSLLEAMSFLAHGKSFRSPDFLQHDAEYCLVTLETQKEKLEFRFEKRRKKSVFLRNEIPKKLVSFFQEKEFFTVLFTPEDIFLPFAAPQDRRRFLSRLLFPLDTELFEMARRAEQILKRRNALLRLISEEKATEEELDFFDETFAEASNFITQARQDFFQKFSETFSEKYQLISGTEEECCLSFFPNCKEDLLSLLKKNRRRDILLGATQHGAHRDDFSFSLRGHPLKEAGSRGEVRSAILALKMVEREYIFQKREIEPILLLDDVFSELDKDRQKHLLGFLQGMQCFLTTTEVGMDLDIPIVTL